MYCSYQKFKLAKRGNLPSEIGELWIENDFEVHFWTGIQHQQLFVM